jgi:2-dehydro-3-deoxygluconokinase
MSPALTIRDKTKSKWDLVSLGEVMLRFDAGDLRVGTTRKFRVWEGGGEYKVARGLRRCGLCGANRIEANLFT